MSAQVTTYAVALAVAVLGARWIAGLDPGLFDEPLAVIAVADLLATVVVFCASLALNNSSMYDPYWSLQPLAIAGYYLWLQLTSPGTPNGLGMAHGVAQLGAREVIVAVLVLLYSMRLTSNFFRDWPGLGTEDFRYARFRRRCGRLYWPVSFLGIHLFPTVMVYLGCLPLRWALDDRGIHSTPTVARGGNAGPIDLANVPLDWLDAVAAVVTLGAIVLAFVADEQLRRFRHDPANAGMAVDRGLWRYSRHPNYLGEILFWWGLYLFALATDWPSMNWSLRYWTDVELSVWTGSGALAITLLFVFVSIPMMERRALATRAGYAEYRRATPMLLPFRLRRRAS